MACRRHRPDLACSGHARALSFGWWKRWSRARTLERRAIPDELWRFTLARFPFLAERSDTDIAKLRELTTLFLAAKEFHGTQEMLVTDDMAVAIAAQACLPVLRLGLQWYDGFVGIVLHADAVIASRDIEDETGVVHHFEEELSGEAMSGGPIMLAWRDVADAAESAEWGYNVVVHEFAHVLDMRAAITADVADANANSERGAWILSFTAEFDHFCAAVDAGEDTFLDPYGAEAPEEFFAVSAEAFFVAATHLQLSYPEVYDLLTAIFKQDPVLDAHDAVTTQDRAGLKRAQR